MTTVNEQPDGYSWSPGIQRKTLAIACRQPGIYNQLGSSVFNYKYITHPPLRKLAERVYQALKDNLGEPLTAELIQLLGEEIASKSSTNLAEAITQEATMVATVNLSDSKIIVSKAVEWAKEEAVGQAAERAAELASQGAIHQGSGQKIISLFQEALSIGQSSQSFIRLIGGKEADILRELQSTGLVHPTGFDALDRIMGGGAEAGLHVIAGDPKMGKTSFLTQIAANAARRGETVWYISGEITQRYLTRRFVSAMTGLTRAQVLQDPNRALRLIRGWKQTQGEILVEYAPKFTVPWMRTRLRQLESQGFQVDQICADYIDIMGGDQSFSEPRFQQASNCVDLRALLVDAGIPGWTAKAVNRGAVSKPVVTKKDLAECFAVAYIADTVLALCATDLERRNVTIIDNKEVKQPILRVFGAAGREIPDELMIAGYIRDNDRQRWTEIPEYLEIFAQTYQIEEDRPRKSDNKRRPIQLEDPDRASGSATSEV